MDPHALHRRHRQGCLCHAGSAESESPTPAEPTYRPYRIEERLPFLVPVMTPAQRWVLRGGMALWAVFVTAFWVWWLRSDHWITPPGLVLNSLLLGWVMLAPVWFFFFVRRMQRPNPRRPVPQLRTAMIVTKAPSEPWSLVRTTLEAMTTQDFPHAYDVWLADERPTRETVRWCADHGVRISTRQGIDPYQCDGWPGRQRCKEGNLAWFYDHWGYDFYDVVSQLDADHVPTPGYLAEMVRPFADPRVGYVAAPSICDRNRDASWAVRGRLYKEATLHGVLQTGQNDGYAPVCIGSHYAVRTAALRSSGGIGPELAEDFSTSYMLSSFGWEGVFAFDAEAHGDGPESLPDCLVQELQWSRSLTKVLLSIAPKYWAGLTTRQKFRFGYAQLWYPLYAVQMVLGFLFPILALVSGTPWVDVALPEFFARALPASFVLFAITVWFRTQGWMRPRDAKFLSWEIYLFQLTRWPWVLWGVIHAFAGWATGREFSFKVTPKNVEGARPLPLSSVAPFLGLSMIAAVVALSVPDPGPAQGYYYLCLLNAVIYLVVSVAVISLHVRENRHRLTEPVRTFVGPHVVCSAVTGLLVGTALVLRGRFAVHALVPESPMEWLQAHLVLGVPTWVGLLVGALVIAVGGRWVRNTRLEHVEPSAPVHRPMTRSEVTDKPEPSRDLVAAAP